MNSMTLGSREPSARNCSEGFPHASRMGKTLKRVCAPCGCLSLGLQYCLITGRLLLLKSLERAAGRGIGPLMGIGPNGTRGSNLERFEKRVWFGGHPQGQQILIVVMDSQSNCDRLWLQLGGPTDRLFDTFQNFNQISIILTLERKKKRPMWEGQLA